MTLQVWLDDIKDLDSVFKSDADIITPRLDMIDRLLQHAVPCMLSTADGVSFDVASQRLQHLVWSDPVVLVTAEVETPYDWAGKPHDYDWTQGGACGIEVGPSILRRCVPGHTEVSAA